MKKHIPNTLTCCNLLSGCAATMMALQGYFLYAFLLIILGAVFDFFDGFAARLLHVSSDIGKELDSLADDITFGFAPAAIVFSLLRSLLAPEHLPQGFPFTESPLLEWLPYAAFLIAAFSALRLAKFNIDPRQATTFIGLPTPANALFWGSLSVALERDGWLVGEPWLVIPVLLGVILACWLLVAEIPMFALKFKHFKWQGNELRYSFILCSAILLASLQWMGFATVIILYVLTSIMNNLLGTKIAEE